MACENKSQAIWFELLNMNIPFSCRGSRQLWMSSKTSATTALFLGIAAPLDTFQMKSNTLPSLDLWKVYVFNSDFNLPYGMTIAAAVWGFWNKTQKLSETLWASFLSDTRLIPNCTSSTKIFPLYPIGLALVKQKRHAQVHFTCGKGLAGLVDGCMDGTAPISLPTTSPLHSDTLDYGR